MKTKNLSRFFMSKTAILVLLMITNYSYSQLIAICGEDFYGVGDVHIDCTEAIVITSTESEGVNGTIVSGSIFSYDKINIIPGNTSVRIVHEIESGENRVPNSHRTKVGGNGGNTGGRSYSLSSPKAKPLSIYPNPTKNNVYITTNNTNLTRYKLYNIYGRLLKDTSLKETNNYSIDITKLKSGIYILKLYLKNGDIITKNIIKQ